MQVMERFERENGGELVVATLCLLEVIVKFLEPVLRRLDSFHCHKVAVIFSVTQ